MSETPKYTSMLNNSNLSYSAAEEQLKPAIRQFLLKWLDPSVSLREMNEIGSVLYKKMLSNYPDEEEEEI